MALVSHASKVLLERIRLKTESKVANEQAGFRKRRGMRDKVTNLKILMGKSISNIYALQSPGKLLTGSPTTNSGWP